jgi:predicted TIM-barrel fold metal-dependent hydrolase
MYHHYHPSLEDYYQTSAIFGDMPICLSSSSQGLSLRTGEMIQFMLARIDDMLLPVAKYLQHPVPEYFLHNFHITTNGFFTDPPPLLAMLVVGADRIMYSVDYPFSANEQGRAFLDHAFTSPADKEKTSHLNAERLLRLEQS